MGMDAGDQQLTYNNNGVVRGMTTQTKKLTEDERIKSLQLELFPKADPGDFDKTLEWLKDYREWELSVRDFEELMGDFQSTAIEKSASRLSSEEYYSNKTANAVILTEQQHLVYQEYKRRLFNLDRARRLILDADAQLAVYYRYIKGYSYKESFLFFSKKMSERTFDRHLAKGIESMANTLKQEGVLDFVSEMTVT